MTTGKRIGPAVTTERSCLGCYHERAESYRRQGDSGHEVYCDHPTSDGRRVGDTSWSTPDWCPITLRTAPATKTAGDIAATCREAGEVVCEVIEALAVPVPDDADPTDLPGYALAVAIIDRCLDRAREEGAEAARDADGIARTHGPEVRR